jgi:predicted ABC-type ATPase
MDAVARPLVVIGGPNGAGKSTCAAYLVPPGMPFVNADEIARDLPATPCRNVEIEAGRLMLQRLDDLERARTSFATETTLASRSLAPRIARLREAGWEFHLVYVTVPSPDLSVMRVAARVRAGGHHVPEETIRRRFQAGRRNFNELYRPLADFWEVYENSQASLPRLVAWGERGGLPYILDADIWRRVRGGGADG